MRLFFFRLPLMSCTSWQISHCSHFSTCSLRQKCDRVSLAYHSRHCCMCRTFPKKAEWKKNVQQQFFSCSGQKKKKHKGQEAIKAWFWIATQEWNGYATLSHKGWAICCWAFCTSLSPHAVVPPAAVSAFSRRTCGKRKWMHRVSRSSQMLTRVRVTRSRQSGNYSSRELFVSNCG